MTQTLALLLDAYRELNARKMFWISLIISGVVIAAFALLGVDDKRLTLATMEFPIPAARFWYKWIFSTFVIGLWISWGAVALALISTAGIFPDLIAGGSIDLYLSKPISRLRLFFTKYLGGLLFVLLQSAVFAAGCYLVFGLRAGEWRTSIFLIIPLVTLMFSYVFALCVLVGVLTRSTVAALLVTIIAWLLIAVCTRAEQGIYQQRVQMVETAQIEEDLAIEAAEDVERLKRERSFTNPFGFRTRSAEQRRDEAKVNAERARENADDWVLAHRISVAVSTVLPKTSETVAIIDRRIFNDEDLEAFRKMTAGNGTNGDRRQRRRERSRDRTSTSPTTQATTSPTTVPSTQAAAEEAELQAINKEMEEERRRKREAEVEAQMAADRAARSRSIPWALSTSIAFEAVILAWAAWVFCRRDY